jgi:photosystem II stability/assembly factor-like uncharacterized protein
MTDTMTFPQLRLHPRTAAGAAIVLAFLAGCSSSNPVAPPPIPPISAVEVTPDSAAVDVGDSFQFGAVAYDTLGAPVSGVSLSWTSGNTEVFTVNSGGMVRGMGEGSAPLYVELGGKRDTAWVVVTSTQPGWYVQYRDAALVDFNGIGFHADGRTGAAVGALGRIVRTDDAGVTWTTGVSNTSFTLRAVCFTSSTEGWAVGFNGTVLRTTNGGAAWTRITSVVASENLYDVHFATRDTGWVVGANGVILRTFNRGSTWQRQNPTAMTLRSVSFSGTRDGWAVGETGVILGTHDRGLTWFTVLPAITTNHLHAVVRRSEASAWAVGALGATPRTVVTPDSTAWELLSAGTDFARLNGVQFAGDLVGFAAGLNATAGGTVLRTEDGGVNWTPQTTNAIEELLDVFFVDASRGWAAGKNGVILHTSDGGGD